MLFFQISLANEILTSSHKEIQHKGLVVLYESSYRTQIPTHEHLRKIKIIAKSG